MENYHNEIKLNSSSEKVFHALTKEIPLWWTEMYQGEADKIDDIFTVRFGEAVFKTIKITGLLNNSKISWYVEDSLINIPELNKQTEWIGTTILWELKESSSFVELNLTHIGLNKSIECYNICTQGWQQFTDSLKCFVETGKGKPFKKPN